MSDIKEELIEALEELLDAVPRQTEDQDWWDSGLVEAVEKAKAVIKKATV